MGTFAGVLGGSLLSSIPKTHTARLLLQRYGAEVYSYADLPPTAKAAVNQLMRDEGGWTVQELNKRRFAVASWPTDEVGDAVVIMGARFEPDEDHWQHGFKHYHQWYVEQVELPDYSPSNPWPSLLDTSPDGEFFIDGWHRFHRYVQLGMKRVPVVWTVQTET